MSDLRGLIPRVRRTLEGPQSIPPTAARLTDDEVLAAIADGVASFLLYGRDAAAGYTLTVTARDTTYSAPTGWDISPALDDRTATAVVAQVALDVFFHEIKALKVSEKIGDEASTWEYALSATLIRDQLKQLQTARDAAIDALKAQNAPLDTWVDFLASRDRTNLLHIQQDWIGPPTGPNGETWGAWW